MTDDAEPQRARLAAVTGVDTRAARPVPQRVHLVGIGGVGMAGVARLLLERGHEVSGSDLRDGRTLEELRTMGAAVNVGHDPQVVAGVEQVVVSTAVPADNPEVVAARDAGTTVVLRARALADLLARDRAVLVAGTHGKTTTTAMAVIGLQAVGVDPSFVLGGQLNETGANAHTGADAIAIAEADEADRSFLAYEPDVAVVTNVELDHPDEFASTEDVHDAFAAFLARLRDGGTAVVCADDPGAMAVATSSGLPLRTYGTTSGVDVHLQVTGPRSGIVETAAGRVELSLAMPGAHNLSNATAALAVVDLLGHDLATAASGLAPFTGAQRRFQRLGSVAGVEVVDDYAHHPTELAATLRAARAEDPERLVVVVQPHRYSRTRVLGAALGEAAALADLVVVTEVYGGPEQPEPGVSGRIVAEASQQAGADTMFEPHLGAVADRLVEEVRAGDLVLVTGAGDVTRVGPALLDRLRSHRG